MLGTLLFKFATWRANVNTDRSTFKEFMEEVKEDLMNIKNSIAALRANMAVLASKKRVDMHQSPTRLNDFGKSISQEIQGKEWAKEIAKLYVGQLKGKRPYDIQKFAFTQAYKFEFSKEMVDKMKRSSWENGVPIEIINRVLAYELRDALLTLLDMDPARRSPLSTNLTDIEVGLGIYHPRSPVPERCKSMVSTYSSQRR